MWYFILMNIDKLKQAEADFLQSYPLGFGDPEFVKMGKKHQMPLRLKQAQVHSKTLS